MALAAKRANTIVPPIRLSMGCTNPPSLPPPTQILQGDENERASGYFARPWDWSAMRRNARGFLHQFHSEDDHLIPASEARHIAQQLAAAAGAGAGAGEGVTPPPQCEEGGAGPYTYEELRGHSHFFEPFAELLRVVDELLLRGRPQGGQQI